VAPSVSGQRNPVSNHTTYRYPRCLRAGIDTISRASSPEGSVARSLEHGARRPRLGSCERHTESRRRNKSCFLISKNISWRTLFLGALELGHRSWLTDDRGYSFVFEGCVNQTSRLASDNAIAPVPLFFHQSCGSVQLRMLCVPPYPQPVITRSRSPGWPSSID